MRISSPLYRPVAVTMLAAVLLPSLSSLVPVAGPAAAAQPQTVPAIDWTKNAANPNATDVVAGLRHTCALTSGGGIQCWGHNYYAQLGDGTIDDRHTPVDVSGLGSGMAALAAGGSHTCALTSGGGVKCWGHNLSGELGDGTTTKRTTPVDVSGLSSGVTALAAGYSHTCALTSGGGVKCWGRNHRGQIGDGTTTDRHTPVDVSGLGSGVTALAAGGAHTCALTSGGGVKCWGSNVWGALGDGTTTDRHTPVDVSGLGSGVIALAAGGDHTCALTSGGGVKCWGHNDYGQLGDGTTRDRHTPVDVSGLSGGMAVLAAGEEHTCVLTDGGGVKCWGQNGNGGLGDGTYTDRTTPVDVSGLSSGMVALAAGREHTCAATGAGGVKCWGNNYYGQLGDGTTTRRNTPVDVIGLGVDHDFEMEDIWWNPATPVAMSDSTIYVRIRNVGHTYVPDTGEYAVGVKVTDTDTEPDDYWYYRFPASDMPALGADEAWTFNVSFWFTRPQVDQIEVTFFPSDGDADTANNARAESIAVEPASESLLDCLSLLLDVVFVYAETHGLHVAALQEICTDFIVTLGKVGEAVMKDDWDEAWDEVVGFVGRSGATIWAHLGIKPARVAISLIKGFWTAVKGAWECGSAIANVLIGLVDDFNARGADINGAFAESPVYVVVTNGSDQRVGFLDDGSVVNEITDAEVLQASDERKLILYPGDDTASVAVTGSGTGYFDLTLAIAKQDGSTHNVKYRDVSVYPDTVGTIDATSDSYLLEMDDDGDGIVDRVESPSEITVSRLIYLPLVLRNR